MAAAPSVIGCTTQQSLVPLYVTLADAPAGEPCSPDSQPMTVTPAASLPCDVPAFITPTSAALSLLGPSCKPACEQSSTEADEGETSSEVDLAPPSPSSDGAWEAAPPATILAAMAIMAAVAPLSQPAPAPAMAQQVRRQFRKSSMCKHFKKGRCHLGQACNFAHSRDELEVVPDLTKTKLCYMYFRGQCNKANCGFAHGYEELRSTGNMYKSEICFQWTASGRCKAGAKCRYAHGASELRAA